MNKMKMNGKQGYASSGKPRENELLYSYHLTIPFPRENGTLAVLLRVYREGFNCFIPPRVDVEF